MSGQRRAIGHYRQDRQAVTCLGLGIGNARHGVDGSFHGFAEPQQFLQVIAVDLDRNVASHAAISSFMRIWIGCVNS